MLKCCKVISKGVNHQIYSHKWILWRISGEMILRIFIYWQVNKSFLLLELIYGALVNYLLNIRSKPVFRKDALCGSKYG